MASIFLDIILLSACNVIKLQRIDDPSPSGHNRSYKVQETPVRNTAHLVFTLLRCYQWFNEKACKEPAIRELNYIKADIASPMYSGPHDLDHGQR